MCSGATGVVMAGDPSKGGKFPPPGKSCLLSIYYLEPENLFD
jgi:hypothetical protein